MVQSLNCKCAERCETKINSFTLFQEIKLFFEDEVKKGIYQDVPVKIPFYLGYSELQSKNIASYVAKWYKCNVCGCHWEFNYPDFPVQGFVRKFRDRQYHPK